MSIYPSIKAKLRSVIQKDQVRLAAIVEISFVFLALAVLFIKTHHAIVGDGRVRFEFISKLITEKRLYAMGYSMIGPLLSVPFWLLDKLYNTQDWWCSRYNFFIFALGLLMIYNILKDSIDRMILRRFLLILICGSMFPCHQMGYGGEVFTAMFVGVGILAINFKHSLWGWVCIILGVLNMPAAIIGLVCIILMKSLEERKWRYFLILLIAGGLYFVERWICQGRLALTGYEGNKGFSTMLPYSGLPGFSYPFFFGLISILFSFGKGIFFFAPGLLLSVKNYIPAMKKELYTTFKLWICFLAGLVIVYSKWWSWYGGWYWGPRFFLFASIPASLALAVRLSLKNKSFISNLFTLLVLALSFWVGINGVVFNQYSLNICVRDDYYLESLCWYVPEFSVLFRPFVVHKHISSSNIVVMILYIVIFGYLALPLIRSLIKTIVTKLNEIRSMYLHYEKWRF